MDSSCCEMAFAFSRNARAESDRSWFRDLLALRDFGEDGRAGKGSCEGVGVWPALPVKMSPDRDLLGLRTLPLCDGVPLLSTSFLALPAVATVRIEVDECVRGGGGGVAWNNGKWKLIVLVSSGSATALRGSDSCDSIGVLRRLSEGRQK